MDKFDKVHITFDLDAYPELKKSLSTLQLEESRDFTVVGLDQPGKKCIEGLVPAEILKEVHAENTDLIMQLGSTNTEEKNSAKNKLKALTLEKFRNRKGLNKEDLKNFLPLFKNVNKFLN